MAYNQNNLSALSPTTVSGSWQMWLYRSADTQATVAAAGYISNAVEMGVTLGDLVVVADTATPTQSLHRVILVNATTGVANLSAGLVIT